MKGIGSRVILSALLLVILLFHVSPSPLAAQTTIHLDDDAPGDPGPGDPLVSDPLEDGSTDHPFDAIQEGIVAAVAGDTVLLADGTYTGVGNRDISFLGLEIIVRSANGPESCTVDCEGTPGVDRFGFEFVSGEGMGSVLQGLTITGASSDEVAPGHPNGIYIDGSSPTIIENVVTGCTGGSGIVCSDSDARIVGNTVSGNSSNDGGGIRVITGSPLIEQNVITGNHADQNGGGLCLISAEPASLANNLLVDNYAEYDGGGVYGLDLDVDDGVTVFRNCTIAGNSTGAIDSDGGGACLIITDNNYICTVEFVDCIFADNLADEGANLWLGSAGPSFPGGVTVTLDHCLIKDATQTVRAGHMTLIQASPVLTGDPLFTVGPDGEHYLGHIAAGQSADSPGLDAGSDLAANVCTVGADDPVCMNALGTRIDEVPDSGVLDLGYHFPAVTGTVSVSMGCTPSSGTLPFSSQFTVLMTNRYSYQARRIQYQIDVTLAGGQQFPSWRRGWMNVPAGQTNSQSWWQNLPAWGTLVGSTSFQFTAADVTPPPYNLPPYPAAGDTDMVTCAITGIAP